MKQYQNNWARESSTRARNLSDKEIVASLKKDKSVQKRISKVKILTKNVSQ